MRKWLAALLTLVLIVGVLPAALAVETGTATFQVGFGQADVTPTLNNTDTGGNTNMDPEPTKKNGTDANKYPIYYMQKKNGEKTDTPIHMAGNFDTAIRLARGAMSEDEHLYMKAVALSDGTNTQVVMTSDFIRVPVHWNEFVEAEVLSRLSDDEIERYCLTEDFVSMSATHTHSSIDIGDVFPSDAVSQPAKWHTSTAAPTEGKETLYYTEYWLPGAVDAVLAALEDLTPTTIRAGAQDFGGEAKMNWVRHWTYSDGTMSGVNFDSVGGTALAHTREADPEMQVIHFVRDGAKDIVLVNFQAHPDRCMGTDNNRMLTSEYCGILCSYLEDNYTDADGLSPHAAYFQGAAGNIMPYSYAIKSEQEGKTSNYKEYGTRMGEMALSVLQSANMITMDAGPVKFIRNEHTAVERGYKTTRTIQQDAVAVGGAIAFVTAGYEMFDSSAMDVKNNSPYAVTFVIENSQGHEYMPDWQTCHYTLLGGPTPYENKVGCHNMVPGTAEDLVDCLVSMLNILYES